MKTLKWAIETLEKAGSAGVSVSNKNTNSTMHHKTARALVVRFPDLVKIQNMNNNNIVCWVSTEKALDAAEKHLFYLRPAADLQNTISLSDFVAQFVEPEPEQKHEKSA